jgi:hypothetical protein
MGHRYTAQPHSGGETQALGVWGWHAGAVIVKASSGPRYVVGCRTKVDKEKLIAGTRVALDMTTLTIMRALPREVSLQFCRLRGEPAAPHRRSQPCIVELLAPQWRACHGVTVSSQRTDQRTERNDVGEPACGCGPGPCRA